MGEFKFDFGENIIKQMTKKDIIEAMKDFKDDDVIYVIQTQNDPFGFEERYKEPIYEIAK